MSSSCNFIPGRQTTPSCVPPCHPHASSSAVTLGLSTYVSPCPPVSFIFVSPETIAQSCTL
jgi:hypothetical protein